MHLRILIIVICLPLKGSITSNSNPGGGHLVSKFTLLLPVSDTGIIIRVGPDTGYTSDYKCRISGVDWIFGRTTQNCGKKSFVSIFLITKITTKVGPYVCPNAHMYVRLYVRQSLICINCY